MSPSMTTDSSEKLSLHDPKTFYVCLTICHLYEQELQARSSGSVYTPEEITSFMAERTIQPSLLDQLNDEVDGDYDSLEEVFGRG